MDWLKKDIQQILKFNPLEYIVQIVQKPEEKYNHKVTLNLDALNKVIQTEVVDHVRRLEKLIFDSRDGKLLLSGYYNVSHYPLAGLFRVRAVNFYAHLEPVWVKNNNIRFRITHFTFENHKYKKLDFIRFLSRFDIFHKRVILNAIVEVIPDILSLTRLKNEVKFNVNYFLNKVPSLTEKISISRVIPENHVVYFYVKSSAITTVLLDLFGPQFISIEPVREEEDSLRILWQ